MTTELKPQANTPMVLLGCIGAPWGVKGHNRIQSYTAPESRIFEYPTWYISSKSDSYKPVQIAEMNGHQLVARLDGTQDRDSAQSLVHTKIYVKREDLPECEENEFYWCDLVGLKVENTAGVNLGTVDRLYETGAHDNMAVKGETKTIHIPFVMDNFVIKVDLANKVIIVDWDFG